MLSAAPVGRSPFSVKKERAGTDPELREGFKIPFVGAGYYVFVAAPHAETIFSRWVRCDFHHKRRVYNHGAMNSNESEWLELLSRNGNRLTKEIGNRFLLEQYVVALSQNSDHVARIDQEDPSLYLDGNPGRWSTSKLLQPGEHRTQPQLRVVIQLHVLFCDGKRMIDGHGWLLPMNMRFAHPRYFVLYQIMNAELHRDGRRHRRDYSTVNM